MTWVALFVGIVIGVVMYVVVIPHSAWPSISEDLSMWRERFRRDRRLPYNGATVITKSPWTMNVSLVPEITYWSMPKDGESALVIDVRIHPFRDDKAFYRVYDRGLWQWKRMSLADKPTAPTWPEEAAILDELVRTHDVLSRLLDQFGLENQ